MRLISLGGLAVVLFSPAGWSAPATEDPASAWVGTWQVSLIYDSTQPPSQTEMVITEATDATLKGRFYGTEFRIARSTSSGQDLIFTAITEDGTGDYIHSGRLTGSQIQGQTLSIGREFLMPWTATKVADQTE